jgi:biopolymer transport protein ExbD
VSFSSPTRDRTGTAFPLASMVDMMFLLLIFFLTTSAFREQERRMDVSLPQTDNATGQSARTQLVITIMEDGSIFLGDKGYNIQTLKQTLAKLAQQFPGEEVIIRGDSGGTFGRCMEVADAAYSAGLRNVSFATIKKRSQL